ncbi:hypothetical protein [Streptomyces roseoverticillatus]|uniref:Uncharacterized protein n=1 Tax=Streptomyces roseoverticillatus TaxID=66429 RepID=A0ABV3IU53_9ACTN
MGVDLAELRAGFEAFGLAWQAFVPGLGERGFGGAGGDLAEGGQAELDHGGSAGDFGVELVELVLGGGEADAEPVDFAEPAFAVRFGDPCDEVDPDLFETGAARADRPGASRIGRPVD